jgi:hypothetical protein
MDNYEVIVESLKKADKPMKAGEAADATGIDKKSRRGHG